MKKIIFILLLIFVAGTLGGCTLNFSNTSKNAGGVFKSYDFGEKWQSINKIKSDKEKKSNIGSFNSTLVKIDPQNHQFIYLGTQGNGLLYSDNAGLEWQNILSSGTIFDIALDHQNSGVIYVVLGQEIYKTLNLGKNWFPVYSESRKKVSLSSLAINPVDNLILYFGTTEGEVYQTQDGGESWKLILDAKNSVAKIMVSPKNTRKVYVATQKKGIFKSSDSGKNWQNLLDNYYDKNDRTKRRQEKGKETFRDMDFDLTINDGLLLLTNYGLLKTTNGGQSWYEISLLTPPDSVLFRALAINPHDNSQIYYSTNKLLYRTFDSGKTWLSSKLPSSRSAEDLTLDPQTPNVLYMALSTLSQ